MIPYTDHALLAMLFDHKGLTVGTCIDKMISPLLQLLVLVPKDGYGIYIYI